MNKNWWKHGERAQELVEFALDLPILLLLIVGIAELALLAFDHNTISNAAREGARVGVIGVASERQVTDAVETRAPGLQLTDSNIAVSFDDPPSTVHVVVTYEHRLITGALLQFLGADPVLEMRTVATMRRE